MKSIAFSLKNADKKRFKQLFAFAIQRNDIGLIEELAKNDFYRAVLFMKDVRKERREVFKLIRNEQIPLLRSFIEKYGVDTPADDNGDTLLMIATGYGSLNILNFLLQMNANPFLFNNDGLMPLHYAIEGFFQNKIKRRIFKTFYLQLRPKTIRINLNDRILKFFDNTTEFFLINSLLALKNYLQGAQVGENLKIIRFNHFIEATSQLSSHYIQEEQQSIPQLIKIFEHYNQNSETNRTPLFEKLYDKIYVINPVAKIIVEN